MNEPFRAPCLPESVKPNGFFQHSGSCENRRPRVVSRDLLINSYNYFCEFCHIMLNKVIINSIMYETLSFHEIYSVPVFSDRSPEVGLHAYVTASRSTLLLGC